MNINQVNDFLIYFGATIGLLRNWYLYKALLFLDNEEANIFRFIWRFALDPYTIFMKLNPEKSDAIKYVKWSRYVEILTKIFVVLFVTTLITLFFC